MKNDYVEFESSLCGAQLGWWWRERLVFIATLKSKEQTAANVLEQD